MGHGRKGLTDQSKKKPKVSKDATRESAMWWRFGPPNPEKSTPFALPVDVIDFMKQMSQTNPQQLAIILLKK